MGIVSADREETMRMGQLMFAVPFSGSEFMEGVRETPSGNAYFSAIGTGSGGGSS